MVDVCQIIAEPHFKPTYIDCVKCNQRTCPIKRIYEILGQILPGAIIEIKREAGR